MTTTRISELTIDFRGQPIRVYDVEYCEGSAGVYHLSPEQCYPSVPQTLEYHVDSGNSLLNTLLENDLNDEIAQRTIEALIYEGLIPIREEELN